MLEPNASVVPIQVMGKYCSLRMWVGLLARLRTSLHHASRFSCKSAVRWTCLPEDLLKTFCTLVKIPLVPDTSRVILRSITRRLSHLHSDVVWAILGVACSADSNLACRIGRRRGN